MVWTNERVMQLARLWQQGLSASQIAELFGDVTRNAVIGKIHRIDIRRGSDKGLKNAVIGKIHRIDIRRGSDKGLKQGVSHGRLSTLMAPPAAEVVDTDDDLGATTTLSEIGRTGCRHVYGSQLADDPAMCGRPVPEGAKFTWCEYHIERFTN